jgi:hypothetical protein
LFCRGTVTSPMLLSWSELLIDEYLFDSSMSESLLLKTVFENCIVPQGGHTQLTAPPINLLYCDGGISTHFMWHQVTNSHICRTVGLDGCSLQV